MKQKSSRTTKTNRSLGEKKLPLTGRNSRRERTLLIQNKRLNMLFLKWDMKTFGYIWADHIHLGTRWLSLMHAHIWARATAVPRKQRSSYFHGTTQGLVRKRAICLVCVRVLCPCASAFVHVRTQTSNAGTIIHSVNLFLLETAIYTTRELIPQLMYQQYKCIIPVVFGAVLKYLKAKTG